MFTFAPLSKTFPGLPLKLLPKNIGVLEEIGFTDFDIVQDDVEFESSGKVAWLKEVEFPLPALDSVSLVLLGGNGMTEVAFTYRRSPDFEVRLSDLHVALRLNTDFLRRVHEVGGEWVPMLLPNGNPMPVDIVLSGMDVVLTADWDISIVNEPALSIPAVELGNTGIILEFSAIQLYLSEKQTPPPNAQPGFKGVFITSAELHLSGGLRFDKAPDNFQVKDLLIGSSGISGHIKANWDSTMQVASETAGGDDGGTLFGVPFKLKSLELELEQSHFQKSAIKGELLLPFFDEPADVEIGIDVDGGFSVALTGVGPDGLKRLTKPDVLELELDSIGFEVKDGQFVAKLSGELTPLFGKEKGFDWPSFKVEELSIDSRGHVHLDGGWLPLREQYELDFNGFKVSITRLGFGQTEDGGKWIGFSGALKLVDGLTAGASVEGLRITWYEDGRPARISFEGIGVEFEIKDVLRFKGDVAYRDLDKRFDGDIKLELKALKLEIDAKVIVGSARGPQGKYNYFAIYLGAELPTGIPLGATPLALYGIDGLFALQMAPDKHADEGWYSDGWYQRPKVGVIDINNKWVNRRGSLALGVGATLGTYSDEGFTFACKALLVVLFPGPVMLIEGRANLLKKRARLDDEPQFRALAVIDMRQGFVLIGLDAQYQYNAQGRVIDIRAGAEAFFHHPRDWYVNMGLQEPRSKRIRARLLQLFDANAYFMLDWRRLATGLWVGFARQWKFGPVRLTLEAWLEANVAVNWDPLHFSGSLWLHGNVEVRVFKFGLGLSVDAIFEADVFDPYHILARLEVAVNLPRPLKRKRIAIKLEWKEQSPSWPVIPQPLKEIAIEHFKVTTSWPLTLFRDPIVSPPDNLNVVPLDCRPRISFQHPVHDDAFVGVNPQPVQPAYERLGDPLEDKGRVRVRYSLRELELLKWDTQVGDWQAVAVASQPPSAGMRKLYGSWAPVPQLPSGTGAQPVANGKLWLWSLTPFDHTRHGGKEGDDWFTANFPAYPCIPQDIPDREVCCDFDRLDRTELLEAPWTVPEHPEITLTWAAPAQLRATILDPPADGFIRALCFQAPDSVNPPPPIMSPRSRVVSLDAGPDRPTRESDSLSINLSAPAKSVRLWVRQAQKAASVCLDFRHRPATDIRLPLIEQGVTIGPEGETRIVPVPTTLGDWTGLECVGAPDSPLEPQPTEGRRPDGDDDGRDNSFGTVINLPRGASSIELMVSYQATSAPLIARPSFVVFDIDGEPVASSAMLSPQLQPEVIRFEGHDLKQVRFFSTNSIVFLHELCFVCAEAAPSITADGFDAEGRPVGGSSIEGGIVEVVGENLSRVIVNSPDEFCLLKVCALFGPDPEEVDQRQRMTAHLKQEEAATRWEDDGEILEPFSTYCLKVVTRTDAQGTGELSGNMSHEYTNYAYFRTEGPPGLTTLSLPAMRKPEDAYKFDSGLDDLTRYVNQTIPATVPAAGKGPVMAKPFYRAYDIGVDFNEAYVDLMYRISERDLGLYLFDSNDRPVRDADGRLLVQSGAWKRVEKLTLTEGERRWLALAGGADDCLTGIEESSIARDKKLVSAVARRVLEPDTVYEARLVPLLLHEEFCGYALNATAQGPSGNLGRWQVLDEGDLNAPSTWVVGETVEPRSRYLAQTSSIRGGNDDASDPLKPGTMLLFGDNPQLNPAHVEQPSGWTDYRLSIYLRAAGDGAIGVLFRCRDDKNYYRLSLDCGGRYRRLVSVAEETQATLAEDVFDYEPQRDYLITIEAIGDALRIYQDGAQVFAVTHAAHAQGSIGLYCYDNPSARFSDVRVDDLRRTAQAVYRYQFTTSMFANFFHHLHSYEDETWRVAIEEGESARAAISKAVSPSAPPSDEEARAFETLATAVLGQAARQNPREVQVTRVDIDGEPLAFLVQSPEPLDWSRIELALWQTPYTRTEPALPGKVKLAAVTFRENGTGIDSVALLLREPLNLTGWRIESRLVMWPIHPASGVLIDTRTLSPGEFATPPWETYRVFEAGGNLPAGTVLHVLPGETTLDSHARSARELQPGREATNPDPAQLAFFSIQVRIVAPNGKVIHARHFLPDDDYFPEDVNVLRKADGTCFFMVKPDDGSGGISFSPGQRRLKLTYHRNNTLRIPESQILSQAGDKADEVVTMDIPLQTQ